jgi:hypothetical protein
VRCEGDILNTVLNSINEKKYDDARIMRIAYLIELPEMDKDWIIRETATHEYGKLCWDCFGEILCQYSYFK